MKNSYNHENLDKNVVINLIKNYLIDKVNINSAYIFGSFGTEEFIDSSDIDIAILCNDKVSYFDILKINSELEDLVGVEIDLNDIEALPEYIQVQVMMRKEVIFCKNDEIEDKYLNKLNYWIKTELPFWKKLMTSY